MATRKRSSHRVPTADWLSPWIQVCEIAWTAPQVIAYRTARMIWGSWPPSARDRREYARMGQEKAEAVSQAAVAAAAAWPKAGAAVLEKTLAPVHRRVLANNRRLSRG
jgi:hypothetical protein